MTDRTIAVRLKLEMKDFQKQMASAAEATRKGAADIDRNGQKIETSMGRMARSVEVNEQAWMRAGGALTAYGVALGVVGVAILKTGIAYNTLQQSSRAALKTVLGSAEAVNEQMAKLDEFARSSPFAKQVFLTAQQQMLAFGIETQKVIPYLDSLQNAVAAAGGNNQTLTELAQIVSKIHAAGKLTAQDFIEFGNRGVDAASIIGSQMGQTGAEIRNSVTKGLLDADDALDALMKGMEERFGGAADNVKTTYVGALDRVKAAWRDFASELTAPLVDPNGGGALVDWMNTLADGMRGFQRMPDAVQNTTVAVVALTGVIALLGGGFLLLAPRILATKTALDQLNVSVGTVAKTVGKASAALAVMAAASAIPEWGTQSAQGADVTTQALLELVDGAELADTTLGKMLDRGGFKDWFSGNEIQSVADAFSNLAAPSVREGVDNVVSSVLTFGQSTSTSRLQAQEFFATVDSGLAQMVASGRKSEASKAFVIIAREAGAATEDLERFLPQYVNSLAAVDNGQKAVVDSGGKTAEQLETEAKAVEAAAKAFDDWQAALASANASFIDIGGAYQAVIDKNRELAQATADATKSSKDSWTDYYDGTTVKVSAFIKQLKDQVSAQREWHDNIDTLTDRVNNDTATNLKDAAKEMLDSLVQQGAAGAPIIDMLAGASDKDFNRIVELWSKGGADANAAFGAAFDEQLNPTVKPTLDMLAASDEYANWVKNMSTIAIKPEIVLPGGAKGGGGGGGAPRRYARGGNFGPGVAMVGEEGPELVKFGGYGHVFTAAQTRDMIASAQAGYQQPAMAQQAPQVITVPVSSTHTTQAPINIGTLVSSDVASFQRDARIQRRNNNLGGRR